MEYQTCRAFGWTHDEYLDTPHEALSWLMHIHAKVTDFEHDKAQAASRG